MSPGSQGQEPGVSADPVLCCARSLDCSSTDGMSCLIGTGGGDTPTGLARSFQTWPSRVPSPQCHRLWPEAHSANP